jgi:zinc protease
VLLLWPGRSILAAVRRLTRLLTLTLFAALTVRAAPWVDQPGDLTPDPAIKLGTLPNGLRYAIRPNAEPKDRVSLRLLVSAGSLVERDDERGLAHFIEHMAFRGTKAFPQDSLVTTLERHCIGLGADNTAFTSYDFTVYHLELPDTTAATLRLGLEVFREYASNLTFDPGAIAKERGVVLSEKDTRNTPQQRVFDANVWSLWPDSRYYRRAPIGLESCIRQFTREQFVAFYDAWYRPERIAVIIVGNVEPAQAAALITEILGPLAARAPPRPEPEDAIPAHATTPDVAMFVDDSLGGVRFNFTHPQIHPRTPNTHAERVAYLHRALAFAMFAKRLEWTARRRSGTYVASSVTTDTFMPGWEVVAFSASSRSDNWRTLAAELEQEHRRAFMLGFKEDELKLAKATVARNYEQAVRSAPTVRSEAIAAQIGSNLLYGGVLTTPEEVQRDLAADLEAATLAQCAQAFRNAWTSAPPHVLVTTNSFFASNRNTICDVLNQSRGVKVRLQPPPEDVTFHYRYFGDPGKLAHEEYLPDLDVHLGRFDNGVRLNFKPTPFEADTVRVIVRVGNGKASQPADQPGLDLLARHGFINGGLVLHTNDELDALLTHHVVSVQFDVDTDAFVFYAQCARRDLLLTMQMIGAYLTDAAYRVSTLTETQAALGNFYNNYDSAPSGAILRRAERVLAPNNPGIGIPEPADTYARTFKELGKWLGPQFKKGAIELSIVGDVSWTEAATAVSSTLGAMHQRDPNPVQATAIPFAAPSKFPVFYPLDLSMKQTSIAWYWPMTECNNTHMVRRCSLLAAVLSELVYARLRGELGATYTPAADFVQYDGWPTFSYFTLRADVATAMGTKAAGVMHREIENLLAHGIDEDVFQRVRLPYLRSRDEDLRSNNYWGNTVLRDAQSHPERLVAARDRATDTPGITRVELEALARRYIDPARGFLFIAEPGQTAAWGGKNLWDPK